MVTLKFSLGCLYLCLLAGSQALTESKCEGTLLLSCDTDQVIAIQSSTVKWYPKEDCSGKEGCSKQWGSEHFKLSDQVRQCDGLQSCSVSVVTASCKLNNQKRRAVNFQLIRYLCRINTTLPWSNRTTPMLGDCEDCSTHATKQHGRTHLAGFIIRGFIGFCCFLNVIILAVFFYNKRKCQQENLRKASSQDISNIQPNLPVDGNCTNVCSLKTETRENSYDQMNCVQFSDNASIYETIPDFNSSTNEVADQEKGCGGNLLGSSSQEEDQYGKDGHTTEIVNHKSANICTYSVVYKKNKQKCKEARKCYPEVVLSNSDTN